jgi:hypothetical protein
MARWAWNKQCWCKSGKKYKDCHFERDEQKRITIQEVILGSKKSKEKMCLHPEADETVCNEIIKAHSIQRAKILESISRNQHVYSFSSHIGNMIKSGRVEPKLIGINEASTFTGFCNMHDTETFKPIELNDIEISNEHIFLIAYRSLCKEIYAKQFQLNMIPLTKEADKGLPLETQKAYQEFIEVYHRGVEAGLNDLRCNKKLLDKYLLAKKYDDVVYYAIEIEGIPDIVSSGHISVEVDFDGRVLQTLEDFANFSRQLDSITFSILMRNSNGLIVFSCFKNEAKSIEFLKSIDKLADNELPNAIVRFAFEFFENNFISPEWWEGLPEDKREAIIKRFNASVGFQERPNSVLKDDGIDYVNWKIKDRYKNFQTETANNLHKQ